MKKKVEVHKKSHRRKYTMEELSEIAVDALKERGVDLIDIAEIILFLQKDYKDGLTLDLCMQTVRSVLKKREVIHAVLTAIELDKAVENDHISEPLASIIREDDGLYGIDEIIPLSIVNIYGSIGLTNFGYLDKLKPGIIKELDDRNQEQVNTFLDDIVAGIAAAGASRLAHNEYESC